MLGHLMVTASKLAKEYKIDDGYRIVMNSGKNGGQLIPNLFLEIIGGQQLKWPPY